MKIIVKEKGHIPPVLRMVANGNEIDTNNMKCTCVGSTMLGVLPNAKPQHQGDIVVLEYRLNSFLLLFLMPCLGRYFWVLALA